jgi:hypothetical protein
MKLQSWARWIEIIANIAVVASVLFLSLEIRKNTKVIQAQSINDRSAAINKPFINSPLIPSILEKIKNVDGPEPGENVLMERYGVSYQEASIWGRYLSSILSGLEAEYLRDGPTQSLQERIQLLFLFPDFYLNYDSGHPQNQHSGFIDYIEEVRKLPLANWVSDYKNRLEELQSNSQKK